VPPISLARPSTSTAAWPGRFSEAQALSVKQQVMPTQSLRTA
jgi:hypothetical protein